MKARQPVESLNFAGVDLPKLSASAARSRSVRPKPSANLRDKVLELKREEIIRVAGELFYSRGFTDASLDDIASQLAIGKPQIYTFFKSKAALLAEVCTRTSNLAAELAAESLRTKGSPTVRVSRIVRDLCLRVIEGRTSMAVLFREVKHLPPEAIAELAANFHSFNRCLGDLLKEGAATGEFSISDASVLTLAISGMTTWIYSWYRPDGDRAPEEIADQMASLALRMVDAKSHT